MNILNQLSNIGIIPVVVIDHAEDSVFVAEALLAGGINVMEITFRTADAMDAIKNVVDNCPDMLVGAGTIITLEQCKTAVEAGARFIVSPGLDEEIVKWCIKNNIVVIPGCVTPSEIMIAMKYNIKIVKFFPANAYGGLNTIKALSGPFNGIKFIPTGGINAQNVGEYISLPFICAVGGSWVCPRSDIAERNFEKISALCVESRQNLLGYEVAHVGLNMQDDAVAQSVADEFFSTFGFAIKNSRSSLFASNSIEVMKNPYLGKHGHLAIRTNCIDIAIIDLEKKGLKVDMRSAKYKEGRINAVYLKDEIGGFAIHLLQR